MVNHDCSTVEQCMVREIDDSCIAYCSTNTVKENERDWDDGKRPTRARPSRHEQRGATRDPHQVTPYYPVKPVDSITPRCKFSFCYHSQQSHHRWSTPSPPRGTELPAGDLASGVETYPETLSWAWRRALSLSRVSLLEYCITHLLEELVFLNILPVSVLSAEWRSHLRKVSMYTCVF